MAGGPWVKQLRICLVRNLKNVSSERQDAVYVTVWLMFTID